MTDSVGDPGVAEAVDGDRPRAVPDFDVLGAAWIVCWAACHGVGAAIGDPDPILLIHGQVEGPRDLQGAVLGLAVHGASQDATLGGISVRQMDDLAVFVV